MHRKGGNFKMGVKLRSYFIWQVLVPNSCLSEYSNKHSNSVTERVLQL
jgi:hypothetical protein